MVRRRGEECHPLAHGVETDGRVSSGSFPAQRMVGGMEINLRPFRALERPFVLFAGDEFLPRMPHLQQHFWTPIPAVLLAVEEIIEETQLLLAPVIHIEMRPVLDAV